MEEIQNIDIQKYLDQLIEMAISYGPNLILALVTFIIGSWVISGIIKGLGNTMQKREMDPSLTPFFKSLLNITLRIMLIISVLSMVGIEMTSFVAILGAAGLAIGLSMQGTLQNFAGGVMILLFKPFKVGQFIDGGGYMGTVKEIRIFNTIMTTP
ncbi:MAG: mechanosensitive ion channel, partial [Cyclobacteriaceae bacterium]